MTKVHHKQHKIHELNKKVENIAHNDTDYSRVENHTNIQFTCEEIQLLSKGLKYSLHHKHKKWIETLALEAETAISQLDVMEQNYYRHSVAKT